MELYDLLAADGRLSFLPRESVEIFEGCFDLHLLELRAGEGFDAAGRLGYLLRGTGSAGGRPVASGAFFGVDRDRGPRAERFTAETDCSLLLWDADVLSHVCYRACWFHVRLLNEIGMDKPPEA